MAANFARLPELLAIDRHGRLMRLACAGDGAYGPLNISGVTRPSGNIRATTSTSAVSASMHISPKFNSGRPAK
jgi:hypothetical protein